MFKTAKDFEMEVCKVLNMVIDGTNKVSDFCIPQTSEQNSLDVWDFIMHNNLVTGVRFNSSGITVQGKLVNIEDDFRVTYNGLKFLRDIQKS